MIEGKDGDAARRDFVVSISTRNNVITAGKNLTMEEAEELLARIKAGLSDRNSFIEVAEPGEGWNYNLYVVPKAAVETVGLEEKR